MNINYCLSSLTDLLIFTYSKGVGQYAYAPKPIGDMQLNYLNPHRNITPDQLQKNIFSLYKKQGIYYFKPVNGQKISEVNPVADQTKILRRD